MLPETARTSLRSQHACGPCKKNKRRCDKSLPSCYLCVRTSRPCDYDTDRARPPPTAAEFANLQARLTELEERLTSTYEDPSSTASVSGASPVSDTLVSDHPTQFPSALFLDIDCYKWAKMRLPRRSIDIPMKVLAILSQGSAVVETCVTYFDTTHSWMPFISKKRMDLGLSFQNSGPDLAMLFLAMKLATSHPGQADGDTSLYTASKLFLATLEAAGVVSLPCLQAMILVAIYEYSQAIYPAAWMTVGACARYADILGLSSGGDLLNIMDHCTTWTEAEERKRVWWAVFILDRIISLGSRRRFSLPEPADTDTLPADDVAWNSGNVMCALNHSVSADYSIPQSPFARLCQSAIFISRAAACRHSAQPVLPHHIAAATALAENTCDYSAVLEEDALASYTNGYLYLLAPRCLAWSALFMLLDKYCCPEKLSEEPGYPLAADAKSPEELAMQVQAILVVQGITNQVHKVASNIMDTVGSGPPLEDTSREVSPFILDALYCAMITLQWIHQEGGDETIKANLADIERCLRMLGKRWRLGLEYLTLQEVYPNISSPLTDITN